MLQLHPKTWLMLGFGCMILALAPFGMPSRICLLLVQTSLLAAAGQVRRYLRFVLVGLGPVAVMAWAIQAVSRGGGQVYARWQPFDWMTFEVGSEGIHTGALLALQVLNFGSACALISLPTNATGIRIALAQWQLPHRLIYLLVASILAPTQLARYGHIVQEAGRARGMSDHRLVARIWLRIRTLSTLFTLILIEHEDRGRSLKQRGIDSNSRRVFLREDHDTGVQRSLRLVLVCLVIMLVVCAYRGVF